jgi:Na+/H+-translocating membrane pyrophosphatase
MGQFVDNHFTEFVIGAILVGAFVMMLIASGGGHWDNHGGAP